jgi:membrane associated rhomboid family serine protease
MVCSSFFLVPIVCSFLTIFLWNIFGQNTTSQGFSGIGAALLAYAIFIVVIWVDRDRLEILDFPEFKAQKKILYYVIWVLLTIMAAFIVLLGIDLGQFLNAGGFTSNGIAHFGGFITGLIVVLLFDVLTEKRKNFDLILSIAIGIGILWYVNYLVTIIKLVKGLH